MPDPSCSHPGCGDPHKAKGYCSRHYQRLKRHGDVEVNLRVGTRDTGGELPTSRRCNACAVTKPAAEFHTYRDNKTSPPRIRLTGKCKRCHAAAAKAWNDRNSERHRAYGREFGRKHARKYRAMKYGMTEAQLDAMEAAQGGRCLICGREDVLVIDHCHTSGAVRGLICNPCNKGLGSFRDDPARLIAAALYLTGASAR